MSQLTQKIGAALAADDWKALAAINAAMATALPRMAAQGRWTAPERAALGALRQAHDQAVRRCGLAATELSQRLADMQMNKEGWIAYALDNEQVKTGTRA